VDTGKFDERGTLNIVLAAVRSLKQ
jgi:hypothetical protein